MASDTLGACKGSRREVLTPFVEILVPRVGRLMPFLCALKFWLWLVWFLDLAISVEEETKTKESTWIRGEHPRQSQSNTIACTNTPPLSRTSNWFEPSPP